MNQKQIEELKKAAYDFYKKTIKKLKCNNFKGDKDGLAHIICEANRISPHGIGGSTFRSWVAGILYKGVYLCAHNFDIEIYISTNPEAEYAKGDQNSCAHGNPWPRSANAELIPYDHAPEIAQKKADQILPEIYAIITDVIEKECARVEREAKEWERERKEKDKAIEDAWAAFEVGT